MSRIFVTGATGFIGTKLVKLLIEEGHEIKVLVRDYERARKLLGTNEVEYIVGDINDKKSMENMCDNISVVYHLAALMGHDLPSKTAFKKFREVNTNGTRFIAESCLRNGMQKFIYVSSTAAMGLSKDKVVNEETPCKPYTPYQVSKYEAELIITELTQRHGLPGVILRPSMIYGTGFRGDFVTIARAVKTGFFPKIGFGRNLSPALYVDDLVDCLNKAKEKAAIGETYIISSEESYELDRVAGIIAKALGVKLRMFFFPKVVAIIGAWILERMFLLFGKKPLLTARNISSATTDRVFDVSKAQKELGLRQSISIEEGLAMTVEYFKAQGYV